MIITICGSSTFAEEMGKAAELLEGKGHVVYVPEPLVTEAWYQENYGREHFLEMKPVFIKRHFDKIENSDGILIMNMEKKGIKGYLGSNTLMELAVAYFLGKKIFLLHPVHDDHPHFEEIAALGSTVLHGNLDNI